MNFYAIETIGMQEQPIAPVIDPPTEPAPAPMPEPIPDPQPNPQPFPEPPEPIPAYPPDITFELKSNFTF